MAPQKEHELFVQHYKQLIQDTHFHHLNTKFYAEHMALNTTYEALQDLEDSLCEKLIGYAGRITGYKLVVPSCELLALPDCIQETAQELKDLATTNKWTDLINLSDSITEIASQLRYLLTLS